MMILTKRFCDPPNLSQIGFCVAKSGYLRCESMVFAVRKYGICSAKVWFLWCKSMFFAVRKYGVSWVYVCILQFVRSVVADRQQHYRRLLAAVGVRFIVPAYT